MRYLFHLVKFRYSCYYALSYVGGLNLLYHKSRNSIKIFFTLMQFQINTSEVLEYVKQYNVTHFGSLVVCRKQ